MARDILPKPIIIEDSEIPFDELDQLRLEAVDFSLPVPPGRDDVLLEDPPGGHSGGNRSLSDTTTISTWYCRTNNEQTNVGAVRIWWGHQSSDAASACNLWIPKCSQNGDSCIALPVTQSLWNCYRATDLKFIKNVQIWWGHAPGDGKWACSSWVSDCGNSPGGCLVTGGMVSSDGSTDCNTWATSDGCSVRDAQWKKDANSQACNQHDYCYHGPIVNSFQETFSLCNDLFIQQARATTPPEGQEAAERWYTTMIADSLMTSGIVMRTGFGDTFQNEQIKTEQQCLLGRSLPQGYTTTPCWVSGASCIAGTSCNNCCGGSSRNVCI